MYTKFIYDKINYYYICVQIMYKYFKLESFKYCSFTYLFRCVCAKVVPLTIWPPTSTGDVLNRTVRRTWEFTGHSPLRTITIPALLYRPPFLLLRLIGLSDCTYALLVLPRLVVCCLGLVNDIAVATIARRMFSRRRRVSVLFVRLALASSYVTFTYGTRPLSNSVECVLFSLLLMTALGNRRTVTRTALIAALVVTGVFNRPTFAFYALAPVLAYSGRNAIVYIQVALYSIAMSAPFVFVDTAYYRRDLVVTPLNFLAYNTRASNLATHGVHPHYLHALVNAPLLFLTLLVGPTLWFLGRLGKQTSSHTHRGELVACVLVPLALLSWFPHQEPRFLVPLLVPLTLLGACYVFATRARCKFWLAANLALAVFYGSVHQSGVTRALSFVNGMPGSGATTKVYFSHCYMPPRHLVSSVVVKDLADILKRLHSSTDDESNMAASYIYRKLTTNSSADTLLAITGTASSQFCLDNTRIKTDRIASFLGHLSTENLPTYDDVLTSGVDCELATPCMRPLVNRVWFCGLTITQRLTYLLSMHVHRLTV